jgi:hypothetical protein
MTQQQTEKTPHRLSDETQEMISSFVKSSTAAQGLPEKVSDEATLRQIAHQITLAKSPR